MPSASHTAIYDLPRETLYDVFADYASYPEFLDHFDSVQVLSQKANGMRLSIHGRMMGPVAYVLEVELERPNRIAWRYVEGSGFHSMEGSCEFVEVDDETTEVTYEVDARPRVLLPGFVVQKTMRDHLPGLLDLFYERALSLE